MSAVALTGELTIQTATERKQPLLAFLEEGDHVEVDLSEVTELDTAGLQLLLLLKREAQHLGKSLRFTAASQVVSDVLSIAHLTDDLDDAPAASSQEGNAR